ncbi:MAG TPA: helix-turn-helix transcriptional regulator [Saprospiraceae bacterium]|nr:helix-turn-helix transcriptional regulator [Saprospiraceae bacterium]
MAFTKNYLYDPEDQQASQFAKALSHAARISILRTLHQFGTCSVETLSSTQPLSQPSISQHLRILRNAQLVICKEKTPHTYYSLDGKNFKIMKRKLKLFLDSFD